MLTSFSAIFILSLFIGLIYYKHKDYKESNLFSLVVLLKGFFAIYLASIINNTGLSMLIAAIGVSLAYFITNKYIIKGSSEFEFLFLGILLRFSPLMAGLSLLIYIIVYFIIKSHQINILLTSFVLLVYSYFSRRPDSLIILNFIIFISVFLQFVSYLEDNKDYNSRFARKSFYIKILSVIFIVLVCIVLFFNRYVYKGFGMQEDIIRSGPREFKYITITFDDGPHPVYTPQVLDILKEKEVEATFFLVGKYVEKYPDIVKRMINEGHTIGNHTYSHRSLIPLSVSNTDFEILETDKVIERITGEKPTLFRPPRGVYSDYSRDLLLENRYTMVLWDVSSQDWRELRYNNIVGNIINNVQNGSIILFHDSGDIFTSSGGNRTNTVKALPLVIDQLRARGYEFVTVDEMLILKGLAEREEELQLESIREIFDNENY